MRCCGWILALPSFWIEDLRTTSHCEHSRPAYNEDFYVRKFSCEGDRHRRPACASVKQSPLKESSLDERVYFYAGRAVFAMTCRL